MIYEVHCPNCGEFKVKRLKQPKNQCPRCGSSQVITLYERHDITDRFKYEREMARPEKYRARP